MKGSMSDHSEAIVADEHKIALTRCIARIEALADLQSVHRQQLALLQPEKPVSLASPLTRPSSLESCLEQEKLHYSLVKVYETMLSQLASTRAPNNTPASTKPSAAALSDTTNPAN